MRSAIDPSEIVGELPNIFIVEKLNGRKSDYRFRLVGTRIVEVEGECTGKRLGEFFPDRDRYADIWRHYDQACAGKIHVRHESLGWRDKDFINYEIILLPLCGPGGKVEYLIGTAHGTPTSQNLSLGTNVRLAGPILDLPNISLGTDGIVTVDYKTGSFAVSPATVRYTRQRILELGKGKAVPIVVLAEAMSGIRGGARAAITEPEHARVVLASAIVATTPAGRKLAEAFFVSHRSPFPSRLFQSVEDARSWLREFI